MRTASPIPCGVPFDWLPAALKSRSAALRKELKQPKRSGKRETSPPKSGLAAFVSERSTGSAAEVARGLLWEGLDWLDKETLAGRRPLRPRAVVVSDAKISPRVTYSLLGQYVELPARLDKMVDALNKHEPDRYAAELFGLVKRARGDGPFDDIYCSRWDPAGSLGRVGVQLGFTVDSKRGKGFVESLDRLTMWDPKWSKASLARALLARGLKEHAPPDFEQ